MKRVIKTQTEFEGRIYEEHVVIEDQGLEAWPQDASLKIVGQPQPRIDGAARVSGQAHYTYDIRLPGMLFAQAGLEAARRLAEEHKP